MQLKNLSTYNEGKNSLEMGKIMEIYGIDVSKWQGVIDWNRVYESNVQFVIINILSGRPDSYFEQNYVGAVKNNIRVGVYVYSYALTTEEILAEADTALRILAGRKLDFPVFLDLERSEQAALGKQGVERLAESFLQRIASEGYKVGIYTNRNWWENYISENLKSKYNFWVAAVDVNDDGTIPENLRPSYGVGWQYSWKGKIPGINTNVDLDVFYTDYESENENTYLVEDGYWGPKTTFRSQQYFKTRMDGIVSNQPEINRPYLYAADKYTWEFKNRDYQGGSDVIKAIQRMLINRGFYAGNIDGWFGPMSISAFQSWLLELGKYTGNIDGSMGPLTVMAWQKYLNQ